MTSSVRHGGGILMVAALVTVFGSPQLWAQSQSLYNRQGPVRSQTNSFIPQTTSSGSALTGSAGAGATALGAQGATAYGATSTMQRGNFVGLGGDEPFVGIDPNAAQGGANGQNARTNRARNTNRGNTNRGNANRGQAGGNQNYQQNQRGNQGAQTRRRTVRPQQRINFNFPVRETSEVVTALRDQFTTHAERYPTLANITVLEQDGRIELYGEVDSPERSRLAALIVQMEPGVTEVINHLTVAESPSAPPLE